MNSAPGNPNERRFGLYRPFEDDPKPEADSSDTLDAFSEESSSARFSRVLERVRQPTPGTATAAPVPEPVAQQYRAERAKWNLMVMGGALVLLVVSVGVLIAAMGDVPLPTVSAPLPPGPLPATAAPLWQSALIAKASSTRPSRVAAASDDTQSSIEQRPRATASVAAAPPVLAARPTPAPSPRVTAPLPVPVDRVAAPVPDSQPAATVERTDATADRVYTGQDRDVRPPQMLSSELPGPAIASWTTRTNSIELVISETGTVEHVRLMSPPQRMPDMMLLSRAKLWKFTPASKDGRPVPYRLVLTWQVNP